MTILGFGENDLVPLVTAVAGHDLDRAGIEEVFARAAWSGIAEPGDRFAFAVVDALGAGGALRGLRAGWSPVELNARLADAGHDTLPADDLDTALKRWMPRLADAATLHPLRQAARVGARLLVPSDPRWPAGVDDLEEHAPLALWVRGTDEALAALPRSMSLVGARAATGYGETVTGEASAGLVDRGYAIVSGAAYGIDGMAHRAALRSGGITVAFLAGGVDRFYPGGHETMLAEMAQTGAVIAELPCGAAPTRWRFLQRNRLIAAASRATVVLEAGARSGSLNTAGHASQLGRPLGAVPGPVTSPASAGCHRLLREFGAVCVTNPDQMAELAPLDHAPTLFDLGDGARAADLTRLYDAMSVRSPRDAADIAVRSGLPLDRVRSLLGRLELDGDVVERERGWVMVPG
ncbi:DNA processing protein [Conyzicola lurida]|uniref:DNA processing protein n=1 Tax=Conyzicola lurida TaxID=1172621 RepID=A0A841AR01_9MICO|nr:DNA-processing protein DprA [Conyzicola lurida]MBB5843849.1 DNA processing protein [Conyzicola lurida]